MLLAKFQDHRTPGGEYFKGFIVYGHCSHLGHVTWTIYINFRSPFLRRLPIKFYFDRPSDFGGDKFLYFIHIMFVNMIFS